MLTGTVFAAVRGAYETAIDALGVRLTWTSKETGQAVAVTAGLKIAGDRDQAIVQTYGAGARIVTLKAADAVGGPPQQFDTFATAGGDTFTAEAVHPVYLNGVLVGFRIVATGGIV